MRQEEVEGVLAHELAHIQNGDMVTMTLIQGVVNAFVHVPGADHRAASCADAADERYAYMLSFVVTIVLDIVLGFLGMMVVGVVLARARVPRRRRRRGARRPRQHDRGASPAADTKELVDNSEPQLATLKINGHAHDGCSSRPTRRSRSASARSNR